MTAIIGILIVALLTACAHQPAKQTDIPVAYGFPAGHGEFNFPLLMGEEATLTVNQESFTLEWK